MKERLLKKIFVFVLAVGLCFVNSFSSFATEIEENKTNEEEKLTKEQLMESLLYTDEDIDTSFEDYAEVSYILPEAFSMNEEELSNAVGTVFDNISGKPIEGVKIFVDGEELTETDKNGRFQIRGLADGLYDWKLLKEGYYEAEYKSYAIKAIWGASIFSFCLSKEEVITEIGFIENEESKTETVSLEEDKEVENKIETSKTIEKTETIKEQKNSINREKTEEQETIEQEEQRAQRLKESRLYTDQDVEEGFKNYAEVSNTVSEHTEQEETKLSNVVGTIFDRESRNPVAGVKIIVNEEVLAETDTSGRFQIRGLADGLYNWNLSKEGYCNAEYRGYGVKAIWGASIFSFDISKEEEIVEIGFEETNESDNLREDGKEGMLEIEEVSNDQIRVSDIQLPSIRVKYPDGSIQTPAYDYYVSAVLSNEFYNPNNISGYYPQDMTERQYQELFRVGAIMIRTFAANRASGWSPHHIEKENFDLCFDDCCQIFRLTERFEMAVWAVKVTTSNNMEQVITYDNEVIQAGYFAYCTGNTKSSKEVTGYAYPYLVSVTCPYDKHEKYFGLGYGLCQYGASRFAYHNYSYLQILNHYYTGTSLRYAYSAKNNRSVWQLQNGIWFYFDENGRLAVDWKQINGKWYYFNKKGEMQTGWIEDEGKWYYCDSSGAMVTGRYKIDGRWSLFDSNGVWLGYDD